MEYQVKKKEIKSKQKKDVQGKMRKKEDEQDLLHELLTIP
jgi:hypothetical protein